MFLLLEALNDALIGSSTNFFDAASFSASLTLAGLASPSEFPGVENLGRISNIRMIQSFLFLIFFGAGIIISIVRYSLKYGISPMPSSKKCCDIIVELAEGKVAELGCGFGGLARRLQKKGCQVQAFEISPIPYFIAKLRGVPVKRKDFFEEDLSGFDTIVCYLYPGAMTKLATKLDPKAHIITNTFALPGWEKTKVFVANDLYKTEVIIYSKLSGPKAKGSKS